MNRCHASLRNITWKRYKLLFLFPCTLDYKAMCNRMIFFIYKCLWWIINSTDKAKEDWNLHHSDLLWFLASLYTCAVNVICICIYIYFYFFGGVGGDFLKTYTLCKGISNFPKCNTVNNQTEENYLLHFKFSPAKNNILPIQCIISSSIV